MDTTVAGHALTIFNSSFDGLTTLKTGLLTTGLRFSIYNWRREILCCAQNDKRVEAEKRCVYCGAEKKRTSRRQPRVKPWAKYAADKASGMGVTELVGQAPPYISVILDRG